MATVLAEPPSMKTISGYINVCNSVELDPPLTFRRWFAQVADGSLCLFHTDKAPMSGDFPQFHLVLDKVKISARQQEQLLQLTYQSEDKQDAPSGISFQVRPRVTHHTTNLAPRTSHIAPHTSHLTPHTSHLTPHTSHLTPHTSHLTPFSPKTDTSTSGWAW